MSDTEGRNDDDITTEPPDPRAGDEDSVAKVGERLQEEVDAADEANGEGDPEGETP